MLARLELLPCIQKDLVLFQGVQLLDADKEAHRPMVADGRQGVIQLSLDLKGCLHVPACGLVEGQSYG